MPTPNRPDSAIACAATASEPTETRIVGGAVETDVNAVTVIPQGLLPIQQVTSTTPLASALIASANSPIEADCAVWSAMSSRSGGIGWSPGTCWSGFGAGRGHAVAISTVTGTPLLTMSKTAERCCA